MSKENIKTLQRSEFDWGDGNRAKSVKAVHDEVLGKIDNACGWYQNERRGKRLLGASIRYTVILLGAGAAALPTVAEMSLQSNQSGEHWWQHPGTATILGVAAGALLILDRFAGATSAWIRFTMAETDLKELRDEFVLSYTLEEAQWAPQSEPSIDQARHALVLMQGFIGRANLIVHNETDQWKTEFQSALQQIDDYAKTQPKKFDEAVGTVKITNPERLAGPWTVSINGGPEEPGANDSKSFRLAPGPVLVRVKATIKTGTDGSQTRMFTTETADVLAAGSPKNINISLP